MTGAASFDIATVVFRGEVGLLALQAASLARFFPGRLIRRILVVINDVDEAGCRAAVETVLPAYGALAPKVEVVLPDALFARRPAVQGPGAGLAGWFTRNRRHWPPGRKGGWRGNRGWSVQQALKLALGRVVEAPHVLILDAKNHLVRPVAAGSFVDGDGRARSNLTRPSPQQFTWIDASFRRMAVPPPDPAAPAPPSITPVCIAAAILREGLEAIERRTGPVETFFARKRTRETEFMLLYADVVARHGAWSAVFAERLALPATIFRSTGDATIRQILERVEAGEADFLSVHGSRLGRLGPELDARLAAIWTRRGLPVPSGATGVSS